MVAMTKIVAADSKSGELCLVIPNTREYILLMIRWHSVFMVHCGFADLEWIPYQQALRYQVKHKQQATAGVNVWTLDAFYLERIVVCK